MHNVNVLATSGDVLANAIETRTLVRARYNSTELELAPHMLFLRNDSLYLSAVNPNKKRRADEAPSLGHFNIAGLSDIRATETAFEPLAVAECILPREDDQLVFA